MRHLFRLTICVLLSASQFLANVVYAEEEPFTIYDIKADRHLVHLVLSGDIRFNFSRAALEALDNGLPLTLITEVELAIPNEWIWDHTVWKKLFVHEIQYHALSQQYLVKGIQAGFPRAYLTRSSALQALGKIENLEIRELAGLHRDKSYVIRVRTGLDSEALPVPLRPLTYLSDSWRLQGDWEKIYWRSPVGKDADLQ